VKLILFCNLPYAFSILKPLEDEAKRRGYKILWYIPTAIVDKFTYKKSNYTSSIDKLESFKSDAIIVPGNDVPYWLQGVKVQISHGLAGEKKDHFRIRDYFDLYLTQGPYFTERFQALADKHKNFKVVETGWCRLDRLFLPNRDIKVRKRELLDSYNVKHIVLYAPTFSPSLTSGDKLVETIKRLSSNSDILILIKFHDKMSQNIKEKYHAIESKNLLIFYETDITHLLMISDLMISDTSSVVYEFLLQDRPVVTLNSISDTLNWENLSDEREVESKVIEILNGNDKFNREETINLYHPIRDGKSAIRMMDAIAEYIDNYGIPKSRKLPLLRRWKMWRKYS
jgi:CDP-glycerol glycerophosphotransferase (TagB/SpsB family)